MNVAAVGRKAIQIKKRATLQTLDEHGGGADRRGHVSESCYIKSYFAQKGYKLPLTDESIIHAQGKSRWVRICHGWLGRTRVMGS